MPNARMLGSTVRTCPLCGSRSGCSDDPIGTYRKTLKRNAKRRERIAWRRDMMND